MEIRGTVGPIQFGTGIIRTGRCEEGKRKVILGQGSSRDGEIEGERKNLGQG